MWNRVTQHMLFCISTIKIVSIFLWKHYADEQHCQKKSAVSLNILSKNKKIIIKIHCWRDQKMTKLCLVLLSNVFVTVLYASNNWEKSVFFTNLINFLSFKISRKGSALLTELLLKLRKLHIRFRCNWMVVTTVVAQ